MSQLLVVPLNLPSTSLDATLASPLSSLHAVQILKLHLPLICPTLVLLFLILISSPAFFSLDSAGGGTTCLYFMIIISDPQLEPLEPPKTHPWLGPRIVLAVACTTLKGECPYVAPRLVLLIAGEAEQACAALVQWADSFLFFLGMEVV